MERRRKEFTYEQSIRMYICTWNLNAKKLEELTSLADLFAARFKEQDEAKLNIETVKDIPEIWAFNFQEIVPLNA